MGGRRHIPYIIVIFWFFLIIRTDSFGQDPDKPDLRESCNVCRGNVNSYSILNVYFSDSEGEPEIICGDTEETLYISVLYSSNSQSAIHNLRIIADIAKLSSDDGGTLVGQFFINEYVGTVAPCPDGTCTLSIPLPIEFKIDCDKEYYELSEPLVAWTPNNSDLENAYNCQDYRPAQCSNQSTIPIEVGALAYSFEPIFDCSSGDISQTDVSFVITSLFGGNPTNPYDPEWEFLYSDGTVQESNEFSPSLLNREGGSLIDASLVVSQQTLRGGKISQQVSIPLPLTFEDVIEEVKIINSDEGLSNGSIDVTFKGDGILHFWTSLDDEEFFSGDKKIENLSSGIYKLNTINNDTGTCRTDFFDISFTILPVKFIYNLTSFNAKVRNSLISWATATEWESSHYEIERSIGVMDDFKKIGAVSAMGWKDSNTEYEFIDGDLPLFGGNIFYRIKQVNINESYAYSDVMSIRTPEIAATKGVWRAYPNPTNGQQLRIGLLDRSQYKAEQIHFRLIHPTLQSQVITIASETEMNEALATMTGQIPKGVFVVEIQWGQKVEHIKVLKP